LTARMAINWIACLAVVVFTDPESRGKRRKSSTLPAVSRHGHPDRAYTC